MSEPILSSNQTHQLHHTFYEPTSEIKATLLIVHGMCEHSGLYDDFANYMATQGIAVATYDQLGHGKTAKSEQELGFFDNKHPVQTLLKDVIIMADELANRHPNVPHFIMGHSMGSFIVRNTLKYHSSSFAGAILMGTADKNFLAKSLVPTFAGLNKFSANKPNQWATDTMNSQLNRQLPKSERSSQYAWLAKNSQAIANYEADPLCGFTFTNNGYLTLFSLMNGALNNKWYQALPTDYPLMLVSGKDDPVGNMGKGIVKLTKRLQKKGLNNVSKYLYPNMRHEPLHERPNNIVYQDIISWILRNL